MKSKFLFFLLALLMIFGLLVTPSVAAEDEFKIGINAINCTVKEGHSGIYTSKWGETLHKNTLGTNLAWNRVAVFDWDESKNAFVLIEFSNTVGNAYTKDALIPENGFAITVNLGNDYSASGGINYTNKIANESYYNFEKLEVGMTAYVTGVDFDNSTIDASKGNHYSPDFTSNAIVHINKKPSGDVYTPDTSKPVLDKVSIDGFTSDINLIKENENLELNWSAVENAQSYNVYVYDSTSSQTGSFIIKDLETSSTSFTLDNSKFNTGYTYTVAITASADGYRTSVARFMICVVKESALDSIFKNKTVVAFGDSLTAMPGWVSMMKSEIGTEVINAGFNGDTTILAKKRLESDVLSHTPDLVIINLGMNDHAMVIADNKPLVSLADYEANYRYIIEKILENGAQIVLVTHNGICTEAGFYSPGLYGLDYGANTVTDFFDVVKKLAKEYDLGLIDIYEKSLEEGLNKICLAYDGIHLSQYGQEKYLEWISTYLIDNFTSEEDFEPKVEDESEDESNADISDVESDADESSSETSKASPTNNNTVIYVIISVAAVLVIAAIVVIVIKKRSK